MNAQRHTTKAAALGASPGQERLYINPSRSGFGFLAVRARRFVAIGTFGADFCHKCPLRACNEDKNSSFLPIATNTPTHAQGTLRTKVCWPAGAVQHLPKKQNAITGGQHARPVDVRPGRSFQIPYGPRPSIRPQGTQGCAHGR